MFYHNKLKIRMKKIKEVTFWTNFQTTRCVPSVTYNSWKMIQF